MITEDYKHQCIKYNSGIKSLYLIENRNLVNLEYDSPNDSYTSARLELGQSWSKFSPGENGAQLIQNLAYKNGLVAVELRIEIAFEGVTKTINNAFNKIADMATDGVVAIVETMEGLKLVVGYSYSLEKAMPLRIDSGVISSGLTSKIGSASEKLVLKCYDTRTAREFTGTL